ncbi:MAG: hypothetical protein WCO72_02830 [Betaproteobacteria bacterium]
MNYFRIFSDEVGHSHISEEVMVMLPFTDSEGAHGLASDLIKSTGIIFRQSAVGYKLDWHCAPRRQLLVGISGITRIETSDGSTVDLNPGDIALAEDLTGFGHKTSSIGDNPRTYAVIPLEDKISK